MNAPRCWHPLPTPWPALVRRDARALPTSAASWSTTTCTARTAPLGRPCIMRVAAQPTNRWPFGPFTGSARLPELGVLGQQAPARSFRTRIDCFGRRVDRALPPCYHQPMRTAIEQWASTLSLMPTCALATSARAARICRANRGWPRLPVTMTFAAVLALRHARTGRAGSRRSSALFTTRATCPMQNGTDHRHGDDREAGRYRTCARNTTRGLPGGWKVRAGLRTGRPQIFRVGADVRRLPGAGADHRAA